MVYKHNRAKDLKKVFEEFTIEEEWHKGKQQVFHNKEKERKE